jgi:hypothetical protein
VGILILVHEKEGVSARHEPWPNPGITTTDSDACTKTSALGEQKPVLPFEGSEQHAAPCTPQISSISLLSLTPPPLDTPASGIPPGEDTTPVRADPHLDVLKPSDPVIKYLGEAGGVPSTLNDAPASGFPEGLEGLELVCAAVGMQGLAGALGTTSVGLAGANANAEVKAQEPGSGVGCERHTCPRQEHRQHRAR